MNNWGLWLRWSWRDLRARWLQVVAIALIIALGTGVFSGLGGQKTWRIDSMNLSYDRMRMHDVKMTLSGGGFVDDAALRAALDGIEGVAAVDTRLVVSTLVDASTDEDVILVEGRLVGMSVAEGGAPVNRVFVGDGDGRELGPEDAGQPVAVVDYKFADVRDLEPGRPIRISGDVSLETVGLGFGPEYIMIVQEDGSFRMESDFAVLFASLETVQAITGREGLVNDAVFLLEDGVDPDSVHAAIEQRMAEAFPNSGFDLINQEDDSGRIMLYTDAEQDQVTWDMVALLFLVGAALGAFNLAGRIVEAQRRQIGIGMALGVPRLWIAFRPMLVGFQIAVLGTIFGLFIGIGLSQLFANLFKTMLPLPYWEIKLYMPGFIQATILGILLPFLATLIPVWRAVRVAPIDAIQSGYLVAKGGGLNGLLHFLPLPGKSFSQMPFRNILRSPWRSLLTVMGIAMAVVLMTAFIGFMDSFTATIDQGEAAYLYQGEDRIVVQLDFFYPNTNGEITGMRDLTGPDGSPLFDRLDTSLILGGTLHHDGEEIDTLLELHDMNNAIWVPKLLKGNLTPGEPGIIISEKAAEDLGVSVGDQIILEHPQREGLLAFRLVESPYQVTGIHDNPLRGLTYLDLSNAAGMGLDGVTNLVVLDPVEGIKPDDVKRALMTQPGVASVVAISEIYDAFNEALEIFVAVLGLVQVIVLIMAFLIAFNSTSINVDERVREISTMFAFGLRIRTVTRMQIIENLVIGILGTVLGVILGWYALNALLVARVAEQLAEFKFIVTIAPTTLIISMVLGIVVVALTPLLSVRRMMKMNIPDTLRVME